MPKLTIDNIEVDVPVGTNVLEAAKQAGIVIPHFCYHQALGSVGACRLCAMRFLEGPVKGIQMSCMIPAQDGMVVSTTDSEAARMRSLVIEWLMINHPHDCPVCDEGGECLLQDYTISGGHNIRRYKGKKRTFIPQYLGENIEHEMNRCIECYRCARFYQDFAGGRDFGVQGSAGRVYFGRFSDGAFDSPFSGNLVDICPTGVFTDKTARYRARYWDYQMAPSVCPDCSLGCRILPAARYRELLKIMAGRNDAVNGWFICDRARFSKHSVNDRNRPRVPMVDGLRTDWPDAIDAVVLRLREVVKLHGPAAVAVAGSSRLSLEGGVMLARLSELVGGASTCYLTDRAEADCASAAARLLTRDNSASMADIRGSDGIVLLDCDLFEEGPMLALAVRKAWRTGAKVYAAGSTVAEKLAAIVSVPAERVATLNEIPLARFSRPVVVCGGGSIASPEVAACAARGVKLVFLLPGPNSLGAALLAGEHTRGTIAEDLAAGKIKALVSVEADIASELLGGVQVVVAVDWRKTEVVAVAQIVLPATTWLEMDGTFINNEGRAQRYKKVMDPGLPVNGLDPALHPPRVHEKDPPGGEARPSWQVIGDLLERLGGNPDEPLTGRWETLRDLDPDSEGVRVI